MYRLISSSQKVETEIHIVNDILNPINGQLLLCGSSKRRLVFVDSEVFWYYGTQIYSYFLQKNIEAKIISVECSEKSKDLETLLFILSSIERFNLLRRDEPIIAVGGGVLMDMVGFASSVFRRGVPFIKVPTTLLSMVDASVGAKTSINHFGRRNRLGSYYPSSAILIDKTFLGTVPKEEIFFALGEIIKISVIKDSELFDYLELNLKDCVKHNFLNKEADFIIQRSIDGMVDELENNLWEKELKRCVDFGHSFSPLLEMSSLKDDSVDCLSHGEAVVLDVIFSSFLSMHRGNLLKTDLDRIIKICEESNLPIIHPYFRDPLILLDSLFDTIKHRNGNQNLPIPNGIGGYIFINDVTLDEIKTVIRIYEEYCSNRVK